MSSKSKKIFLFGKKAQKTLYFPAFLRVFSFLEEYQNSKLVKKS